jgi:alpha,alpha-trehalase
MNFFFLKFKKKVIEALLSSKMFVTSKGIVQNFLDIVKQKGFVPNGARIYYLNRSQPPLLTQMFYAYFMTTKDTQFLLNSIDLLEREYLFWMSNKRVTLVKNGKTYELNSYNVTSTIPRPESYREDFAKANESSNATRYYSNVMSAAESGWDFSSRWFLDPQDIRTISITDMIPVDLNAIMYRNEFILAELFSVLNNKNKSEEYERAMQRREEAIHEFLWDSKLNTWADLNVITNKLHTDYLYITDLAPLWFNVKPKVDPKIILARYDSLLMSHVSGKNLVLLEKKEFYSCLS